MLWVITKQCTRPCPLSPVLAHYCRTNFAGSLSFVARREERAGLVIVGVSPHDNEVHIRIDENPCCLHHREAARNLGRITQTATGRLFFENTP
jgi:hypothetical protein